MGTRQAQIDAFLQKEWAQDDALQKEFLAKNADLVSVIEKTGFVLEYVGEYDRLYITLGEPREGIALFIESLVVMADPDTLELLAVEILDFKKSVNAGELPDVWQHVLQIVERDPFMEVSPKGVSQLQSEFARVTAALERELVAV